MSTTEYLIARIQQGGDEARAAREALYQRYHRRVLFHVRVRMGPFLRSREALSDIAQEAMMNSLAALDGFVYRTDGAFMAFLACKVEQVIRDKIRSWYRRKREAARTVPLGDENGLCPCDGRTASRSAGCEPADALCLGEDLERLAAAMDRLREEDADYWLLIVRRDLEEMRFSEIGEQLGKTADAVKQQYYRARARLAILFGADAQ